jgi:hypothetical protein
MLLYLSAQKVEARIACALINRMTSLRMRVSPKGRLRTSARGAVQPHLDCRFEALKTPCQPGTVKSLGVKDAMASWKRVDPALHQAHNPPYS